MVVVVVDSEGVSANINTAAAIYHGQARGGIYRAAVIKSGVEAVVNVWSMNAAKPATN